MSETPTEQVIEQRITCNQLILLLNIYRGTTSNEDHIGTFLSDLGHLQKKGFITIGDHEYKVSPLGEKIIGTMLTIKLVKKEIVSIELGTKETSVLV